MSVEVLEAQQQLDRARDNLRTVEEGIKRTNTSIRRGAGGSGRAGRGRLAGRIAGVPRFREETDAGEDEPPFKKSLSSVASRLGPINIDNKKSTETEDEDLPAVKSTVILSAAQDRETASSVVNDSTNLNRSKRLFGSLLMGTLRQFKQDKEKNKSVETKQADMWQKVDKKEAEQEAKTAADHRKLEAAKEEGLTEIKLLEEKIELAQMKDRIGEERDKYSGFIRTRTKPPIYYLPKEHTDRTSKSLKESQDRVTRLYQDRIERCDKKLSEIEHKLGKSGMEKHLGELSTIKLDSIITKTIRNDDKVDKGETDIVDKEEKPSNPQTGIKVEVKLRNAVHSEHSDDEQDKNSPDKPIVVKEDHSLTITINKSPHKSARSDNKHEVESEVPKSTGSQKHDSDSKEETPEKENRREGNLDKEKVKSSNKKSVSPDKRTSSRKRSAERRERRSSGSKRRRSSPSRRWSRSPDRRRKSPRRRDSKSPRRRKSNSKSPRRRKSNSKSPRRRKSNSKSPRRRKSNSKSPRRRKSNSKGRKSSSSPKVRSHSPKSRSRSPKGRSSSPKDKSRASGSPKKGSQENGKLDGSPGKPDSKISASSKTVSKSRSRSSSSGSSSSDSGGSS